MEFEGGCYCGAVRYKAEGQPLFQAQCHCRECCMVSGGLPNVSIGMPLAGVAYTKGEPKVFRRSDLENPVAREFCGECGTHLVSKPPGMPAAIVKVGTMDDPSQFAGPQMAIFLCDKQPYQHVPEGIPSFDRMPG